VAIRFYKLSKLIIIFYFILLLLISFILGLNKIIKYVKHILFCYLLFLLFAFRLSTY